MLLPRTWLLHTKFLHWAVFARSLGGTDFSNEKQCFYKFSGHFVISFLHFLLFILYKIFYLKAKMRLSNFYQLWQFFGKAHFLPGRRPHQGMRSYATMNLLPIEKSGTDPSTGARSSSPSGGQSSLITLYSAPFFDFSYRPFAIGLCFAKQ